MFKRLTFKLGSDGNIVARMKVLISTWLYCFEPIHCAVFNFLSIQQIPPETTREANYVVITWRLPISLKDFIKEKFKGCDNVEVNF